MLQSVVCSCQTSSEMAPGIVYSDLSLEGDTNQHYALYLPHTFTENSNLPLIVGFEPDGRGDKWMEHYYKTAEKLNFVFIASNTFKNGMDFMQLEKHYSALIEELKTRMSYNPSRIYVFGFSGGARAASYLASRFNQINGLMAVGAAANGNEYFLNNKSFHYVQVLSYMDFNYLEIMSKASEFQRKGMNFMLIPSDQFHESIDEKGFETCLNLIVMNDSSLQRLNYSKEAIQQMTLAIENRIIDFIKNNRYFDAMLLMKNIRNGYLQAPFSINYDTLKNNGKAIAQNTEIMELLHAEIKQQQLLLSKFELLNAAMNQVDLKKTKIDELLALYNQWEHYDTINKSIYERFYMERLKAFAGILSYSFYKKMNKNEALNRDTLYLKLWETLDARQSKPSVLLTQYYLSFNNIKNALEHLQRAAERGYADTLWLKNVENYERLTNDKNWIVIWTRICENAKK